MLVFTPMFVDTFQRPNEDPLNPANWTPNSIGVGGLSVVSNRCVGEIPSQGGIEFYTGLPLPADQYSAGVVGAFRDQSELLLFTRSDLTCVHGYGIYAFGEGTQTEFDLLNENGPIAIVFFPRLLQPGDVILSGVFGKTIFIQVNGQTIISVQDTTATVSGLPALGMAWSLTQTDTAWARFETGGISDGTNGALPVPLPFSKRTTAAMATFACIGITSPMTGAPLLTANVATISALALVYGQLTSIYPVLIHQDTANDQANLYAAVAKATTAVQQLSRILAALPLNPALADGQNKLQRAQIVVANALTNLENVQVDETAAGA